MPIQTTPAMVAEKNRLDGRAWVHLFALEYAAGQFLRVCDYSQDVVFNGQTYAHTPMKVGEKRESAEGGAETLDVVLANAAGEIDFFFENYDLAGRPGTLYIVSTQTLADPASAIEERYVVAGGFSAEGTFLIRLVLEVDLLQIALPLETFNRNTFPGLPVGRRVYAT